VRKSATNWLFDRLLEEPRDEAVWNSLLRQAVAMEKDQITQALFKKWVETDK